MSKLNPTIKSNPFADEKLAGGAGLSAAKQDNYGLLRRAVLANLLWEDVHYMDGNKVTDEISRLIPLCTPEEVAALAVEARIKQKLRHTPLFLAVEMLKHPKHKMKVSGILPVICTRADMLTDFLAIYKRQNGKIKPLAKQAKIGLANALANFSEYQLAKYDRSAEIKLRDVLFLTHAKPPQGKEELYKKIADRTLDTPDTWEVALSAEGNKAETWIRLIEEGKLGGLAMLRNIANMRKANVPMKEIEKGLAGLKSSMLLPLDFLKSSRMNPEFSRQIEDSMVNAYKNLPRLPGKTLFIVDVSTSMGSLTSANSQFGRLDQACAMAMLAINQCEDCDVVTTGGNDWTSEHKSLHIKYPKKGFDVFEQLSADRLGGGGIFTRQCLEWCKENVGKEYDRIIVFSDSQDCDKKDKTPKPYGKYNYICDVSNHTKGINFKGRWTAEISGWSEAFLSFIAAFEGLENKFQEQ